jgi:uncharacterized membrane protein YjjB (DUF3815 family)
MMLFVKTFAVFIMSFALGILYRIPRTSLLYGSIVGALSWLMMYSMVGSGYSVIFSNFLGSIIVGLGAEALARGIKMPATVFIVPGFIPLVPGREAYMTMLYMVEGQYTQGTYMGMQTVLIGGAIAFGIFISSSFFRLMMNYVMESKLNADKSERMD